jgi:hypothetical protein
MTAYKLNQPEHIGCRIWVRIGSRIRDRIGVQIQRIK